MMILYNGTTNPKRTGITQRGGGAERSLPSAPPRLCAGSFLRIRDEEDPGADPSPLLPSATRAARRRTRASGEKPGCRNRPILGRSPLPLRHPTPGGTHAALRRRRRPPLSGAGRLLGGGEQRAAGGRGGGARAQRGRAPRAGFGGGAGGGGARPGRPAGGRPRRHPARVLGGAHPGGLAGERLSRPRHHPGLLQLGAGGARGRAEARVGERVHRRARAALHGGHGGQRAPGPRDAAARPRVGPGGRGRRVPEAVGAHRGLPLPGAGRLRAPRADSYKARA